MRLLLPLLKTVSDQVFSGSAKFVYTTTAPSKPVISVVIFQRKQNNKGVVGEAKLLNVIRGTPSEVWELTKHASSEDYNSYQKIYHNQAEIAALELGSPKQYAEPAEYHGKEPLVFKYICDTTFDSSSSRAALDFASVNDAVIDAKKWTSSRHILVLKNTITCRYIWAVPGVDLHLIKNKKFKLAKDILL